MNSTRIAEKRAKILRPILEIEKKDLPVSQALEDAAWELGLSKSHTWSLYLRLKQNDARASVLQSSRREPKSGSRLPQTREKPDMTAAASALVAAEQAIEELGSGADRQKLLARADAIWAAKRDLTPFNNHYFRVCGYLTIMGTKSPEIPFNP